eukprot:scaffold272907_cov60-Attheya_sp.AAC.5
MKINLLATTIVLASLLVPEVKSRGNEDIGNEDDVSASAPFNDITDIGQISGRRLKSVNPCSISFYVGQTLTATDAAGFPYTVTDFGTASSKFEQISKFDSTSVNAEVGVYESTSGNTASYSDGDLCDRTPRSGTVVVETSSAVTSATFFVSEPSTCVYEFLITVPDCSSEIPSKSAKKSKCSKSSEGSTNVRGLKIKSC